MVDEKKYMVISYTLLGDLKRMRILFFCLAFFFFPNLFDAYARDDGKNYFPLILIKMPDKWWGVTSTSFQYHEEKLADESDHIYRLKSTSASAIQEFGHRLGDRFFGSLLLNYHLLDKDVLIYKTASFLGSKEEKYNSSGLKEIAFTLKYNIQDFDLPWKLKHNLNLTYGLNFSDGLFTKTASNNGTSYDGSSFVQTSYFIGQKKGREEWRIKFGFAYFSLQEITKKKGKNTTTFNPYHQFSLSLDHKIDFYDDLYYLPSFGIERISEKTFQTIYNNDKIYTDKSDSYYILLLDNNFILPLKIGSSYIGSNVSLKYHLSSVIRGNSYGTYKRNFYFEYGIKFNYIYSF